MSHSTRNQFREDNMNSPLGMEKNGIVGQFHSEPKITQFESSVNIEWAVGHERKCGVKWLQSNCKCGHCKDLFDSNVRIEKAEVSGDCLECVVSGECDHVIKIPLQYLFSSCNCQACIKVEIESRKKTTKDKSVPYSDYETIISSNEGRFSALSKIIDCGFCVVRNFPVQDKETALEFARSMGSIRSTLYGHDWVVRSRIQPTNAAYTSISLPSHNDLIMYETAPGVQFLLAQRFDEEVVGGESFVIDAIKCAEMLRQSHPEHFETLCRVPATFDSIDMDRDIPVWLWHTKPHFEVDYFGELVAVNWHPGLESTLRIREKDAEAYYKAYKVYMKILHNPQNRFTFRLRTGDMMILNNRRVMHARWSYQSLQDGDRSLLGFYIDMDDLKSHYMEMAKKLNKTVSPPKIGNRSSF